MHKDFVFLYGNVLQLHFLRSYSWKKYSSLLKVWHTH